ncbi:hypothetical protein [Emcibacter sp. SYSU 3D8]|uniref:hypothetical protein n=1 Tax=Emcibacter sp. SYSU 3D8 TaxID=3133969 RepID=UPI0031FEB451
MGVKKIRRDTNLSISRDRAEQLRRLAEAYNCSPREVIEDWISNGLKTLGLNADGIPHWAPPDTSVRKISVNGIAFIELRHAGLPVTLLRVTLEDDTGSSSEALALAKALEEAARVNRPWEYNCTKHGGRRLDVRRRGGAVILTADDKGDETGEERPTAPRIVLSPAMTEELADAIRFLLHSSVEASQTLECKESGAAASAPELALAEAFELAWQVGCMDTASSG